MQIICDSSQLRLCAEGAVSEAVTPSSKLCTRHVHRYKHCLLSLDTHNRDSPRHYIRSTALSVYTLILCYASISALPRRPLGLEHLKYRRSHNWHICQIFAPRIYEPRRRNSAVSHALPPCPSVNTTQVKLITNICLLTEL